MDANHFLYERVSRINQSIFIARENNSLTNSIDKDNEFYTAVADGDINSVIKVLQNGVLPHFGDYSKESIQNDKINTIISMTLYTYCKISGGFPASLASLISNHFIQFLEECTTDQEIKILYQQFVNIYSTSSNRLFHDKPLSVPVRETVHYIFSHLHEELTLEILSKVAMISPRQLSRKFKEETGFTIFSYIKKERIETAKLLLIFSKYNISEIAQILCFCSESYFTKEFKKFVGVSPKIYKESQKGQFHF